MAVRNIFYKTVYDKFKPSKIWNDLSPNQKSLISGMAGALGSLASNGFTA